MSLSAQNAPGTSTSDWCAIALLVSGGDFDKQAYTEELKQYVTDKYATEEKLSRNKATEWHRISIVLNLLNEDVTDINGINLLNDGIFYRENLGRQGINAYIWALIAASSGNYIEPEDALNKKEDLIARILSKQNPDGSFSLKVDAPDCDITAMAIYALSAHEGREEVVSAINNAVNYLSSVQNEDGSFSANGIPNSETTSQVIIALSALGYDVKNDPRFPHLYDALLAFRTEDGFSHTYNGVTDVISTYQAICAIAAADRQCAIYTNIQHQEIQPSEEQSKQVEVITIATPEVIATEAIEEETTLPEEKEVVSSEFVETATETNVHKTQQNSFDFYIFLAVLIVIILIYGIINRRKR